MKKRMLSHLLSMLIGGLIFGSVAYASNINVQFLPLKYFINSEQKVPLHGQEGFIYNGRVYVPLRFISESLNCDVAWERATSSVYLTVTPPKGETAQPDEQKIYFTGTWKTESGSIYNLKQIGTSVTGTFTHYADDLKHEFPVTGIVNGKTVQLTWTYDDAEAYKNVKNVPSKVANQVVGITESAMLTIEPNTNILDGFYFQDYVEWDPSNYKVLNKFDGISPSAINKVAPLQFKLYFKKI